MMLTLGRRNRGNDKNKKGQAPHSTQPLRIPLLPSGPDGVLPIVVAWDPTLIFYYLTSVCEAQRIFRTKKHNSLEHLFLLLFEVNRR